MTFTTLQWLGPELARDGLVRNESWIEEHCAEAVALFPNQGLHTAATLMASLHPNALDYIKQAPVLVVAASYGRSLHRKKERLFVAQNWGSACHQGPKLRDLMASFKIAYQLRALDGVALCPTRWKTLQLLSELPASGLAQMIPQSAGRQMQWLRAVGSWLGHVGRQATPVDRRFAFEWVARESAASAVADLTTVADYILAHRDRFNPKWTMKRALELAEAWHRELGKKRDEEAFFKSFGIGFSDPIDYAPFPNDPVQIDSFDIVPLRTGEELFAEGAMMHHCVSSYSGAVVRGNSRIFSVRKDGSRIATFEVYIGGGKKALSQLKGPCNATPAAGVRASVAKFLKQQEAA